MLSRSQTISKPLDGKLDEKMWRILIYLRSRRVNEDFSQRLIQMLSGMQILQLNGVLDAMLSDENAWLDDPEPEAEEDYYQWDADIEEELARELDSDTESDMELDDEATQPL